jgi:hypothetical protein
LERFVQPPRRRCSARWRQRHAADAERAGCQLRREGDDGEGGKASIPQLIARTLAAKALAGDVEAIREIFDRMDGTSVAAAAADEPPGRSCSNGTRGETGTKRGAGTCDVFTSGT